MFQINSVQPAEIKLDEKKQGLDSWKGRMNGTKL